MPRHPLSKQVRDNRANQLNPQHPAYHRARGMSPANAAEAAEQAKATRDNKANQLNPNNAAHDQSRGTSGRPGSSSNTSSEKSE